ncbi:ag-1 blood stage membrane protein homologue, putative [Plasmodium relictum]|uniref:Ag-1 blood stage membrane protein homologue, putative n=1 Tax=Plasmodium relictum TaxID=85471 RepID=A0A1J1H1I7_PLARL|nr:ag-1 blood stage membrane protein homologue, putative [Plasmodium relictum]CRG98540.1 ag-1 blood stage membrane protein homologue, putative [Plasmodium relictum]
MLGTNFILNFFKNKFNDLSKKCFTCIIRSYKRACPHISDFEPFASMYYFSGLHNYRTFYLLIRITEIFNINKYKKIYIIFSTDKYDFKTDEITTNKKNRIHTDQRVDIKIRQCDETLNVNLFTTKLTKKIHIGEIKIDINSSIVMKSFPKNQWFVCFKDGQEICKVQMSFYKIQKYACPNECMLIQDGLEIWKNSSKNLGENKKKINFQDIHKNFDDDDENLSIIDIDTDINDISLMQKLRLISFVLEQEIYVFDFYAYVPKYMSAKEIMGEWFLCFLCFKNNKEDETINIETIIERNIHRDINIPLFSIHRIVIDNKDNTNASIIYSYEDVRYNLCIHSKKHLSYIIDAITLFTNELKILKESYGEKLELRKNRIMQETNMKKLIGKRRVSSPRFRRSLPKSTNKMINEMYLEKSSSNEIKEKKEFIKDEFTKNNDKNEIENNRGAYNYKI